MKRFAPTLVIASVCACRGNVPPVHCPPPPGAWTDACAGSSATGGTTSTANGGTYGSGGSNGGGNGVAGGTQGGGGNGGAEAGVAGVSGGAAGVGGAAMMDSGAGGIGGHGTGGAIVIDCPDCVDDGACVTILAGSAQALKPDGTPCRNGNGCDGFERCLGGRCQAGTPPPDGSICGDGLVCTAEVCHRASDLTGPFRVMQIEPGIDFTCSALEDGTVRCSGHNTYGALGGGTDDHRVRPFASIVGIGLPKQMSVGGYSGSVLLNDRTVQFWGRDTPATLVLPGIASYSYAGFGMCVLLEDGSVECWDNAWAVTKVIGVTDAIAVSAADSPCALRATGAVQCWGSNNFGQLGDGTTVDSPKPVDVIGINNAIAIATGGVSACALLAGGTVRCWGNNYVGALGNGTNVNSAIPVEVVGITDAQSVTVGDSYACAVLADRTAKCWGWNGNGTLGDGTTSDRSVPAPVKDLTTVAEISAGNYHTCAVLVDHTARCWGANHYGQLGDGTTVNRLTPVEVTYASQ